MTRRAFFFVLVPACVLGCTPAAVQPPAEPPPNIEGDYPAPGQVVREEEDGSAAARKSPCGRACENLRSLDCSDGYPRRGVTCYRACLSMATHTRVPTACWSRAATLNEARACGGVRCLSTKNE